MARFAPTTVRSASLAEDFGLQLATRWFGEEAIASLPRLQAGKNKGKVKGSVYWLSTTQAGYHPNAGRAVAENTTVRAWIGSGPYEESAVDGMWMGRMQRLCGSRDLLSPEYRARAAAEIAADRARYD